MNAIGTGQTSGSSPTLTLVRNPEPDAPAVTRAAAAPRAADEESIRAVWHQHGSALTRFALKLTLGDRQRAEDIVQETMVRAWRHPEIAGDAKLIRPWLFTVTRHVAIDMWRARSRCEEIMDDQSADRPDPAEPIEQAMIALDVRAALEELSIEHRQVIVGMYYQSASVLELAERLGIPEGTVKSRAYYGLRQLKRVLAGTPEDGGSSRAAAAARRGEHPMLPQAASA